MARKTTATLTPNEAARVISKAVGRTITPKAVRSRARALLPQYNKAEHRERQSHAYTPRDMERLTAAFRASSGQGSTPEGATDADAN